MRRIDVMASIIGDASIGELGAALFDYNMPVQQDLESEPGIQTATSRRRRPTIGISTTRSAAVRLAPS